MHRRLLLASICVAAASALAVPVRGPAALRVSAAPRAQIAGVQLALRTADVYRGPIDGIAGPLTTRAILTVQRAHRLPPTGHAGPETLRYLGRLGRPSPGSRVLTRGMRGLDVSALQFDLRAHGYALSMTGSFDTTTRQLLIRFQRAAGLAADGLAGRATWSALARAAKPSHLEQPLVRLRPPVTPISRTVAARGGTELFCTYGSAVAAATAGTVVYAGDRGRGYGYTVITRDASDVQVLYGHLSRIDVRRGQRLIAGAMIGLAGWTGKTAAVTSLLLELSNHGHVLDPTPALQRGAT